MEDDASHSSQVVDIDDATLVPDTRLGDPLTAMSVYVTLVGVHVDLFLLRLVELPKSWRWPASGSGCVVAA